MGIEQRRVVVTGLGINTPIGDDLDTYYDNLIAGTSAITRWKWLKNDAVYSKVGGDLSQYDIKAKVAALKGRLPVAMHKRLRKIVKKAPMSTAISTLVASDAFLDAGLDEGDPVRRSTVIGGHNLNERYFATNYETFQDEPDYIDSMAALLMLDTDHAGSVSEVLGHQGAAYTMGGACASANVALRAAIDEVRYHDHDLAILVGAVLDFSAMGPHAMALMGAITFQSFNDEPHRASRPYDTRREGFVPSHGAGALIIEELEHAKARGAKIYCEITGYGNTADANHLTAPAPEGEGAARCMRMALRNAGLDADNIHYINAHGTSTPQGDICETQAIRAVFKEHADNLVVNSTKGATGHMLGAAGAVEMVLTAKALETGIAPPTINYEHPDPECDLDYVPNEARAMEIEAALSNSFGFGGHNATIAAIKFTG